MHQKQIGSAITLKPLTGEVKTTSVGCTSLEYSFDYARTHARKMET